MFEDLMEDQTCQGAKKQSDQWMVRAKIPERGGNLEL